MCRSLKIQGIEPGSLTASLSADGKSLNLSGKRQIEGCTCGANTIGSVDLPYTPNTNDVELTYKEEGQTLTVRLARHPKPDKEQALSIAFTTDNTATDNRVHRTRSSVESADENKQEERRPVHFVPHESAASDAKQPAEDGKLDTSEKSLMAKFRSAAAFAASSSNPENVSGDDAQAATSDMAQPDARMESGASPHTAAGAYSE